MGAKHRATPRPKQAVVVNTVVGDKWTYGTEDVELVSEMLGRRWTKGMIASAVYEMAGRATKTKVGTRYFHRCSQQQINDIINDARKLMMERLQIEHPFQRALALEFYEGIIRSPTTAPHEKLRAQERIDSVLGLDAKFDLSKTDSADAIAAKLREAAKLIDFMGAGTLAGA